MKKALIVVDVQKYFAVEQAKDLPKKIVGYLTDSASEYDVVLFTKFRNDPSSNFHTLLNFTDVTQSPDTDLHDELLPFVTDENTFEKTTYSAMKSQELMEYLSEHNVRELHLCGVSLDACVLATAFDAFDLGYDVSVLDNLCSVSSARDDLVPAARTIINRDLRRKENRFKRST